MIEINLIALFTDVTANKNTTILLTNKLVHKHSIIHY